LAPDEERLSHAASLAEGLARLVGFSKPPVLPEALLEDEPVAVFGEDFGSWFDGRLEYYAGDKNFGLFFNTYGHDPSHGRSRFSLAHETGHYFLDEHRRYLEAGGKSHNSKAGFQVDATIEREADVFAANLLMPRFLLEDRRNESDMDAVIRLATDFQASLLCAARRLVETTYRACTLVVSQGGRVQYSRHSEEMKALGYVYVRQGTELPPGRVIRKARSGQGDWAQIEEKVSSTHEWSGDERGADRRLWMETVRQPAFDRAITLLIYEREPGGGDDDDGDE
jgi:Zn-dependent peptidase ImmA (M78 family)